jgi:hypothetical protein
MKRNVFIWVAIGAALVVIFNVYPQADVIPGYVLMPLAIASTIFLVYRQRKQSKGTEGLILSRFKPEKLLIAAVALFVILTLAILLTAKIVHPDYSQLKYFAIALMVPMFILAGIFLFASVDIFKSLRKRD